MATISTTISTSSTTSAGKLTIPSFTFTYEYRQYASNG